MNRITKTRGIGVLLAVGALAVILALVLPGVSSGKTETVKTGSQAKVYKFVISNNFLGNDWRPTAERIATLTSKLAPFNGKISLQIVNSQNTTQAQIASLNDIVASKPDVLMIDAGSPTALNPVIARACAAGIVVISFDQIVTAKCPYHVYQDHGLGQRAIGQWMAKTLHGTGGVFVDRGLPGAPQSIEIQDNFLKGLKKYGPNIKVLGQYDGKYAIGPEEQAVSALLASNPDVSGVHTQGYCTAIFSAFKQAGKKLVACTAYSYNGELVACVQNKVPCAALSASTDIVQVAMKLGLDVMEGKSAVTKGGYLQEPMTLFLTGPKVPLVNIGPASTLHVEYVKLGVNAFPKLAPGLMLPYTLAQYKISPEEAAAKR